MVSAIAPAFALWEYGPYPEAVLIPLVLGGGGGLAGFVCGVMVFRHPLREEIETIWSKVRRKAV
jgi:hypothetical protein